MRLNATEKNAKSAIEYLLWVSKIKVTSSAIREELCLHPDFPSIASVSDALSEWKVPNMATRLHTDQLREIPLPALAYLKVRGGILAPVKSVKNELITWLDTQTGWQTENIADFQQKWDGVTLLIEPTAQSREIDYDRKHQKEWLVNARWPILAIGLAAVLAILTYLIWKNPTPIYLYLLLGTKLMGTVLSGLLLWQSVDTDNPFLQSFCQVGNRNNCNGILQSKAANLTPWLSWSEVGFFYFSGGFLSIVFAILSHNLSIITGIGLVGILSLPYTIYSVYYQKFVARQWCKLCMAVQAALWLEAIIVLSNVSKFQYIWNVQSILLLALAFLIPMLLWIFVKDPISEATQVFGLQRELQKVKFNEHYIQTTFKNQPQMPPIFEDMRTVKLGEPDAENILTVVTNPLCGPCAKLHQELKQLIMDQSNIQCQFIFIGPSNGMHVAKQFLSLAERQLAATMDSWYHDNRQDINQWVQGISLDQFSPDAIKQLNLYSRWCELAGISATPTVFINGVKLPVAFQIKDIKRIVPALPVMKMQNT